jgi:signal transduction histidine kinase
LRHVLYSAIETAQPLIDAAGHTLVVEASPGAVFVDADFTRLAQAFANLLHNAVKYTPNAGRITVRATLESGDVIVEVSDTGIGIAAAAIPTIFDMFMQSGETNGRGDARRAGHRADARAAVDRASRRND